MKKEILEIENLSVEYKLEERTIKALENVDLRVYKGEALGIAGESGCGKSTLAYAILNSVPYPGKITSGKVVYDNTINILKLSDKEISKIKWKEIALVPQASQNILNPVLKIYDHFEETFKAHEPSIKRGDIKSKAKELLEMVRLDPKRVLNSYPHELSGGMRQRVIIALSLIFNPKVLILDEPTSALDVLTQYYFMRVLNSLKRKLNITIIFITHDMAVLAEIADRIAIMYAGKIVEVAPSEDIFLKPKHPYTEALIKAIPSVTGNLEGLKSIPGQPPDLASPPPGCRFAPRCPYADNKCQKVEPKLKKIDNEHMVACLRW